MKENSEPKRHHLIPRAYLKGFLNPKQKIFVSKIHGGERSMIRKSSLKGMGYREHFYKVDSLKWQDLTGITDPLIIEKEINPRFENQIPFLIKLFSNKSTQILITQAFQMAELLLHLKRRNLYARQKLYSRENMYRSLDNVIHNLRTNAPNEFKGFSLSTGIPLEELINIAELIGIENIVESDASRYFHNMSLIGRENVNNQVIKEVCWKITQSEWTVYETLANRPFITTDNPGFVSNSHSVVDNMGFGGNFQFYFPLSSTQLLLITHPGPNGIKDLYIQVHYKILNDIQVEGYNLKMAQLAVEEIYASNETVLNDTKKNLI